MDPEAPFKLVVGRYATTVSSRDEGRSVSTEILDSDTKSSRRISPVGISFAMTPG